MPYGGVGAYWALLGPDITLRRTAYDTRAAGRVFHEAAASYPDIGEFVEDNVVTVPSDAETQAVFSK
jgi:hypothetical protein